MTAQRKEEAEEKATDALLDGLLEVSEIDVPQVMIDSEIEDTFNSYSSRIQQQGLTMDFYLQIMGLTEAGFKEQIAPEAEKRLRIRLVLEAVADDLALEVTEEDVTDEYNALATQYEMDVEQIKSILPTDYLVEDLKVRKALDTLKTTNKKSSKKATKVKVEETKVEEEEKEEQ